MKHLTPAFLLLCLVPSFAFTQIAFFGRNFEMYKAMFCFSEKDLEGKRILDAASGPSTFLAEMKQRGTLGAGSVGVDIGYGTVEQMESSVEAGMKQAFAPIQNGSYKTYPLERQVSMLEKYIEFSSVQQAFLRYFRQFPELYVHGDIRDLSSAVGQAAKFDYVLSANLLFLYSERDLDEAFHRDAILSMANRLKDDGELRIFPLDDLKARSPEFLPHLLKDLEATDLNIEIRQGCSASTGQVMTGQSAKRGQMLVLRGRANH